MLYVSSTEAESAAAEIRKCSFRLIPSVVKVFGGTGHRHSPPLWGIWVALIIDMVYRPVLRNYWTR
jgi:hypothetical protein